MIKAADGQNFVVYRKMLRYVLLQKTQLQHPIGKWMGRHGLGKIYTKIGIPLIEQLRINAIIEDFSRRCKMQFEDVRPYLPNAPLAVLDIGSGLGGVDILLNNHYRDPQVQFYLLDKSGMADNIYYGLSDEGAHYSSHNLTHRFLENNGLSKDQAHVINISTQSFPVDVTFDLIMSFISWDFHYNIETYLEETLQVLSDKGVMLIDIRKGSGGIEKLKTRFSNVQVIPTQHSWSNKWEKVMVKK
ncbi:MAG: hypothetical protein K9J79_08355 [Desulfobacteraceae bacterium]|nr:hypothetical protein [Desulfobacteraceae bacterium]